MEIFTSIMRFGLTQIVSSRILNLKMSWERIWNMYQDHLPGKRMAAELNSLLTQQLSEIKQPMN